MEFARERELVHLRYELRRLLADRRGDEAAPLLARLREMAADEARFEKAFPAVRLADGEAAIFEPGEAVRIAQRFPIGHYRVPRYIRGKLGVIEAVIEPRAVNNEEEGFGRNAGSKRHYYRVSLAMADLWRDYPGSFRDQLKIEVYETWLEEVDS